MLFRSLRNAVEFLRAAAHKVIALGSTLAITSDPSEQPPACITCHGAGLTGEESGPVCPTCSCAVAYTPYARFSTRGSIAITQASPNFVPLRTSRQARPRIGRRQRGPDSSAFDTRVEGSATRFASGLSYRVAGALLPSNTPWHGSSTFCSKESRSGKWSCSRDGVKGQPKRDADRRKRSSVLRPEAQSEGRSRIDRSRVGSLKSPTCERG